jgi:phage gp45-like
MQESGGNFMKGETRDKVESPQNYGFSSVCMDGDKGQDGNVSMGPEAFIGFMGGNRSFPVCMVMDDRRHRLKELEKGDTAMFRTKDDRQQIHMTKDGTYQSTRDDRVNRIALVPPPQQQQQQDQGGQSGGQQQQKATGQKAALDDNKKSKVFVEQSKDKTHVAHNDGHTEVTTSNVVNYYKDKDQHSTTWDDQNGITHKTKKNITRQVDGTDTTTAAAIGHNGPTGVNGNLGVVGSVTAASYGTISDARIKSAIRPLGAVLTKVMALKVRAFNLHAYSIDDEGAICREGESTPSLGLIAQDVRTLFPDLVPINEETGFFGLYEDKIGVLAVAALQEYIDQTNRTIGGLMQRINRLERGLRDA